jgi:hypothetical protein
VSRIDNCADTDVACHVHQDIQRLPALERPSEEHVDLSLISDVHHFSVSLPSASDNLSRDVGRGSLIATIAVWSAAIIDESDASSELRQEQRRGPSYPSTATSDYGGLTLEQLLHASILRIPG